MKRIFTISDKVHGQGGIFYCWQKSLGNYLATTGYDKWVRIYNRHGELVHELNLPGMCTGFGWDANGDTLAVINDHKGVIFLWNANNKKLTQVDVAFRDALSCMVWSKTDALLAVGTAKGNLIVYNHKTGRKSEVAGKHTKKITCGAWSKEGILALGGDDHILTLSTAEGDRIREIPIQGEISDLQFSKMKADEKSNIGETTLSLIKGKKMLYLYCLDDPENPIELNFSSKYGDIVEHKWYGDGYILIGFSKGFLISISTHMKEIGQEIFNVKDHKDALVSIAVSSSLNIVASAGDNCVKVHELLELKEMYAIIQLDDERSLDSIMWTDDGQLLAVSSARGSLHIYLTKLPILGSAYMSRIAYLTSLLEVTVQDEIQQEPPTVIQVDVEPSFVSIGPYHLAVGMNNRAWFYFFGEAGVQKLREKEYLGTVQSCCINGDYAAVRFEGRVSLHMIDETRQDSDDKEIAKMFPDKDQKITCHDLTKDFLIYGTDKGTICYFYVNDWIEALEFRHVCGIRKLFPDPNGTRVAFIDDKADGHILNPVNESTIEIPEISPKTVGILWDKYPLEKGVFITFDEEKIKTYIYNRETIKGPEVLKVGETHLPFGHVPLLLYQGELTLQTSSGSVQTILLNTHLFSQRDRRAGSSLSPEQLKECLKYCLSLRRFHDAWGFCEQLISKKSWTDLGMAAMHCLDVDYAIKVYREIGDVGMVMSLDSVKLIEDRNLLSGYLAMFMDDFNLAQELFLNSSKQVAALEMRRDLMHWDIALKLAKTLDEHQIPYISKEYATQLEFLGDYPNALRHYEQGITKEDSNRDHDEACAFGVARMSIRMGDLRRGITMAMKMPSVTLKKECAAILENMKQYSEAAVLFEKGLFYDKAAAAYIRAKNWSKVGELLPQVKTPKIHGQYARAKEAEGKYKEAANAYETAKDWDNAIRVYLDHLQKPDEAIRIVRTSQSTDGARMVAKFFEKLKDFSSAIQFLVLSKCNDEAFQLAQKHGHMEKYADIIGPDATPEDYSSIAVHFENEKNHYLAGKFFFLAGKHSQALNHLLNPTNGENADALNLAVDVVGQANDQQLTKRLIGYLMGDEDNMPKDFKYLFRLYMALKQYREAANTAIIIAREEQNGGSYRVAHDLLFEMYQELRKQKIKIPAEMVNNLMLLHSYTLVKIHNNLNNHLKAARMLIRIAKNISKFPAHVVQLLTSTVISCHKAGLKNSAFSYGAMLMRPEYRDQIPQKHKKKIESFIRKPEKSEIEEPRTPCPFCDSELPETELTCASCKNSLPFCIATGCHIVKQEMTLCPSCQFPAILPEFLRLLEAEEGRCPMCTEKVNTTSVEKTTDINKILHLDDDSVE